MDNGDKIWLLSIYCPNALSINLLYEKFWMPEKAKFFIYSENKKHILGAFTLVNNKGTKDNIQGFATGLVYSDKITLEYYQPSDVKEKGTISIAYVVHGYRYINLPDHVTKSFGGSGDCQVNVNCSEGQNWQNEKNSVALILVNGNRYCTGSLINTTANDNRPLFLTADHCLGGWANDPVKYDAISNPNLNHWSFYWNYESPSCSNSNEPPIKSTVGATVLSNNSISDFALLQLTEDPRNKTDVTTYYLGWDLSGNSGTGGVGIHHPVGDVKKIATYNITPPNSDCFYSGNTNFWKVNWQSTTHGWSVTEGGSSGSPLININHRVIGQLYGAGPLCSNPNCSNPSQDIGNYGKFSVSWTGNGATDSRRRLSDWLDPCGSNVTTLNGVPSFSISGPSLVCSSTNSTFTLNNRPTGTTVNWTKSSNLEYVSGQNTDYYTVRANATASGPGWVHASLNSACSGLTYSVWVGSDLPNPVTIDIRGEYGEFVEHTGNMWELCPNSNYYLRATPSDINVAWDWSLPESWELLSYEDSPEILIQTGEHIMWEEEAHLDVFNYNCDTWIYSAAYILTDESPSCGELMQLLLYPNPAKNSITLKINENELAKDKKTNFNVSIVDNSGRIRINKITTENLFNIDISSLPIGEYTVVISNGNTKNSQRFIKSN